MWPAVPEPETCRPLAARWSRAVVLTCACTAVAYALLLAVPQALLTRWTGAPRATRELLAAVWFAGAFAAVVAALVRLQRPGRLQPPGRGVRP